MQDITPHLWFDNEAREAGAFYTSVFPGSRVKSMTTIHNTPSGSADIINIELAGQPFTLLSAGPLFKFNEAVSLVVEADDQAEVDRLWDALTADGGEPGPCGWLKDRFGLSWQIAPRELNELVDDPDPERARRAMEAMLQMGKIEIDEIRRAADAA